MEIRSKETHELLGYTEEFKPGTARTVEAGPLQKGVDYEEYDVKLVMYPTRIHNEIFLGYAIMATDLDHAQLLPGFKPFGAGGELQRTIVTRRRDRAIAMEEARAGKKGRRKGGDDEDF